MIWPKSPKLHWRLPHDAIEPYHSSIHLLNDPPKLIITTAPCILKGIGTLRGDCTLQHDKEVFANMRKWWFNLGLAVRRPLRCKSAKARKAAKKHLSTGFLCVLCAVSISLRCNLHLCTVRIGFQCKCCQGEQWMKRTWVCWSRILSCFTSGSNESHSWIQTIWSLLAGGASYLKLNRLGSGFYCKHC